MVVGPGPEEDGVVLRVSGPGRFNLGKRTRAGTSANRSATLLTPMAASIAARSASVWG
jgi:hypothetical protein